MRKFNKNIAKEFKTSFGRFIAIMAIIALGVGFLIGVTQATPDMKNTMDHYLVENEAYDVDVKGTFGLTQADIDAIRGLKDDAGNEIVESVTPVISTDAVVTAGEYELTLVEGEWPEAAGEVVVAQPTNYFEELKVGDTITLPETLDNTSATYGDVYAAKIFTVVGIVSSPDYFYNDAREITTLGSGVVGAVIYGEMGDLYDLKKDGSIFSQIDEKTDLIFTLINNDEIQPIDVRYTDCYVKLVGSEEYERFTDNYKNFVLDGAEALERLGKQQIENFKKLIIAAGDTNIGNVSIGDILEGMGLTADSVQWLVLDRANANVSYISFDMNVEKVEEIAGIFPVFFIVRRSSRSPR